MTTPEIPESSEAVTNPEILESLKVVTDHERLDPTDGTTATESSTTKKIILIKFRNNLEDKDDLTDEVVDWLRKEDEDPDKHRQVEDKVVSVIFE